MESFFFTWCMCARSNSSQSPWGNSNGIIPLMLRQLLITTLTDASPNILIIIWFITSCHFHFINTKILLSHVWTLGVTHFRRINKTKSNFIQIHEGGHRGQGLFGYPGLWDNMERSAKRDSLLSRLMISRYGIIAIYSTNRVFVNERNVKGPPYAIVNYRHYCWAQTWVSHHHLVIIFIAIISVASLAAANSRVI